VSKVKDENKLDLGTVRVHKKVLAEIIYSTINDINGIILVQKTVGQKIIGCFTDKSFPGIDVKLNDQGDVRIDVKLRVRYGLNIPSIAKQMQDTIKSAVSEAVDIQVAEINVNIVGIFGKQ